MRFFERFMNDDILCQEFDRLINFDYNIRKTFPIIGRKIMKKLSLIGSYLRFFKNTWILFESNLDIFRVTFVSKHISFSLHFCQMIIFDKNDFK